MFVFMPLITNAQSLSLPFSPGEKIHYDIYYHWGLIWKKAGEGSLGVNHTTYKGQQALKMYLHGQTLNFADKMLKVRDTLNLITTHEMVPLYYSKVANEGSHWGKDILHYSYDKKDLTTGKVRILRNSREPYDTIVHANGQGYDMLSVFYYLRMLDYSGLNLYEVTTVPIFTGRKQVKMKVKYMGRTVVKLRSKKEFSSYRLNLSFVNDDNLKESDDPIEVWLSDDARRIPLKVEGKLPIGSLQAEYRD